LVSGALLVLFLSGDTTPSAHANIAGPAAGVTGAPGEVTCANCHTTEMGSGFFTITAPTTYTPGTTYQITVRHTTNDDTRRRWGFQLTALTGANVRAGTLATANANVRILTGGPGGARQYAEHTEVGTFAGFGSPVSWTFNWTAPANDVGPVTFRAAGLQCNNNGNELGDQLYTTSTVSQSAVGGDFTLNATPPSQSVQTGASTSFNLSVTPSGGFSSTVNLSVSGLPGNVTPTFAPASIANASGTSTLTLATNSFATPGSYPLTLTGTGGAITHTANVTLNITPGPPVFQFMAANFNTFEGDASPLGAGSTIVTVNRSGNTGSETSVDFAASDGTALQRTDFTSAGGTLNFAAGETSKVFAVIITDDKYQEAPETINLTLSNPGSGAMLGTQATAILTINDNDIGTPTTNPIDESLFFVQQHYSDFLNRPPDQGGWDFWTGQITNCGADITCLNSRRIGVSAAYFVELEFQLTGSVIYRLYRAAYGSRPAPDQSRVKLNYADFTFDRPNIVGGPGLAQSTIDFANRFTQRAAFLTEYPATMTNAQFVNKVFDTANLTPYIAERQAEIDAMTNQGRTRAQVLLNVIDIQAFKDREYNPSFVLMQYFGYLRRDPDQGGYDFWLGILNAQPANARGMVCAFITSTEYQERFSSISTRNNSLCNGNP
jgi:hypothetical protein